jgi:hypothetical protein
LHHYLIISKNNGEKLKSKEGVGKSKGNTFEEKAYD